MKPLHHRFLDATRIRTAILQAERSTDASIAVFVAPHFWGSARRTAQRALMRKGLTRSPSRNAVLFFLVPSRREFVIVGDAGAHFAVGQATWDVMATALQERLASGDPTDGVVCAIEEIGRHLARHFPPADGHVSPSIVSND
jgi:uncharacterized membrane protein